MKKLLATVLVLVMALSIFAGCGGGGSTTNTQPGGQQGTNGGGETVRPVVTVGIPFSTNVEDYDTNKYTLWLEEKTGLDMEIIQYPSAAADYKAKITTQIVGGEDLPDLLWRMAIGDDAWKQYADEGYIMNLKPLLEDKEKSKVFWERIDEINKLVPDHWPTIQRRITYTTVDDEEGWWCLGRWEQTLYDNIWVKPFINQTWLTKLGLDMPKDAASLREVLIKFATEDCNGNGEDDEIPLYQSGGENTAYDAVLWFINMFTCCMPNMNWNVKDDGVLLCPYTTDAYREGLKYARDLFNNGVFNTALKSGGTAACKTLLANNPSTVGVVLTHPSLGFQPNDMNLKNYVAMPQWSVIQRGEQAGDRNAFLTESAEDNIDDVWKLVMQMMTKESSIWQRYGEFGTDWTWADEGAKSWFGIDAEIKILDGDSYWTTVDNAAWHSIGCTILTHAEFENVQKEETGSSEWYIYKMTIQGQNYQYTVQREAEQKANGEYITAPIMVYNTEDTEELRAVRSNVRNVFTTMRSKFVYGTEGWDPFDNQDWEDYLKMVKDEGYDEYYAQAQKVFDYNYPKWPSLEQ